MNPVFQSTFDVEAELALLDEAIAADCASYGGIASSLSPILARPLPVDDAAAQAARPAVMGRALAEYPLGMFASRDLEKLRAIEAKDQGLKAKIDELAVDSVVANYEQLRIRRAELAFAGGVEALATEPHLRGRQAEEDRNAEERAAIMRARARLGYEQIAPAEKVADAMAESLKKFVSKIADDEKKSWQGFGGMGASPTVITLQAVRVLFARQVIANIRQFKAQPRGVSEFLPFARSLFRGWLPADVWTVSAAQS